MKRIIENIAIFILFLTGIRNIWSSLPFKYVDLDERILSHTFSLSLLALHHAIYLVTGVLMLIVSYYLYHRLRLAWVITLLSIAVSIVGHLLHIHSLSFIFIVMDIVIFTVLALGYRDFHRKSPRTSLRRALPFIVLSITIYIAYVIAGFMILKTRLSQTLSISDIFIQSGKALLLMDNTLFVSNSVKSKLMLDISIISFWGLIFVFVALIMRPLVITPLYSKYLKNKAFPIVKAYGENPMAYLSLEDDKQYFFSKNVEGLCSYTVVGNVLTICGDIICSDESASEFMSELIEFANHQHYNILLMNITTRFKKLYEDFGFGFTKCGEDACFDLSTYSLQGGAVAKVRAAINRANKDGITVSELVFNSENKHDIITSLQEISDDWVKSKDSPELVFMLGKNNFNTPYDRRYFYASDSEGKIIAYCVFNPYKNKLGYIAEITRRRHDASQGALEKIIYDAFMTFKSEGAKEATLGLSPLYNVMDGERYSISSKAFSYIYDNMSAYYNFKALHHSKEKFAPTHWESRYYAYNPKPFSPVYAYAIVMSQHPKGLLKNSVEDAVKQIFRKWLDDEDKNQ